MTTRSPRTSHRLRGLVSEHKTVKWPISQFSGKATRHLHVIFAIAILKLFVVCFVSGKRYLKYVSFRLI